MSAVLQRLLEHECVHADALRDLLDEEHQHLGARDFTQFARIVEAKHQRVTELNRCASGHLQLVRGEPTPEPPESESSTVSALRERLRGLLEQCRMRNERNAATARRLGQFNARLLRVLSGQPSPQRLYGPAGHSAPLESSWSRYSASA